MANKILNGARAQVSVGNSIVGWLDNVTWQVTFDIGAAFVLGKTAPAELDYLAQEPISGNLGGWRVLDHGVYAELGMPTLDQLLVADYTTIVIFDRNTQKRVGAITQVRLGGFGGGTSARQMEQQGVPYQGILWKDETATNSEAAGATQLP